MNPMSLLSDKIVIRSVHVESPEITFEGGLSGNNLSKIMDNVNAVAQAGGPPKTNTTAKASKPAQKIEVDDFLITGAKVHASITGIGGKELTLDLPPIHLTDLGKGSDGITPTELTHAVLKAITSATIKAVSDAAPEPAGRPVALIEVIPEPLHEATHLLIENVAVLPEWHGKGIGGLLGK